MSRKKPPRITNDQMGAAIYVSDFLLADGIERIARLDLLRRGRQPSFRYRGRWPYRAFGKPVITVTPSHMQYDDPLSQSTLITAKWSKAVALWRKP